MGALPPPHRRSRFRLGTDVAAQRRPIRRCTAAWPHAAGQPRPPTGRDTKALTRSSPHAVRSGPGHFVLRSLAAATDEGHGCARGHAARAGARSQKEET